MSNYMIWKNEFNEIIVQVFNEYDLRHIQKDFIDKGYYILETFQDRMGDYYFKVVDTNNREAIPNE